jgi:hypothetical protein
MILSEAVGAAQRLARQWDRYYETVEKPAACIDCDADRVGWNGSRTRSASVVLADDVQYVSEVRCRRVKCGACHKSWTLRPSGLCAHKHYQLCVVAKATSEYLLDPRVTLSGVADRLGCARRTVGRWICWVSQIADAAVVMQQVLKAIEAPLVMPERRVTQLVRKARSASRCCVLERAMEVLGALEALASAWRLEPPGLRSVVERVVGNRTGIATYARPSIPELAQSRSG